MKGKNEGKPMTPTFGASDTDKKKVLSDAVWYEILFAFGIPGHDPNDYCQWEAINFSRTGHARALYDFLTTKSDVRLKDPKRRDDAFAEDYGFPARTISRPREDRDRLNKDLFHLTYSRLRHSPETKPWPDSILSCLFDPSLDFMRHVDERDNLFNTKEDHQRWTNLLTMLETRRELHIRGKVGPDNRPHYELVLGGPLPSGKPALTRAPHLPSSEPLRIHVTTAANYANSAIGPTPRTC